MSTPDVTWNSHWRTNGRRAAGIAKATGQPVAIYRIGERTAQVQIGAFPRISLLANGTPRAVDPESEAFMVALRRSYPRRKG